MGIRNRKQDTYCIAFGWSYFGRDESYEYDELKIYLGLISLNFKWQ